MTLYDVLVIGGGAAGLSAGVTLARSLRNVLVVDAGEPRNAPADGVHNLLGHEGMNPLELLAAGRAEATAYGAEIMADRAVAARRTEAGFAVDLASGRTVRGRRLVLATGLIDELPDVPGVREHWGNQVLHCPYCHGYEVSGRRIAVLASSSLAVHQALLFRQLTSYVTVLMHRQADLGVEETAQLQALGVRLLPGIVERVVTERIRGTGNQLMVHLADGARLEVDVVVVGPRMHARGELYAQLGGTISEHPMGNFIETGPMGRTPIEGVWAVGNVSDLSAMVSVAAGEGTMAAAAINAELAAEDARAAAGIRATTEALVG
jgi:thioredoxin reductase (NADPH)